MQSDHTVLIRFSDEFEQELYRLSKRFRNIRSDVQPIIEQLQQGNFVGDAYGGLRLRTRKLLKRILFKR